MIVDVTPDLTRPPIHGGNLEEIAATYGVALEQLIDFSSNVNPAGPPDRVVSRLSQLLNSPGLLARYPEPECRGLSNAIATHLDVEPQSIVVANGSAALIDIVLRGLSPRRCLVPIPAFSEYDRAIHAARIDCCFFELNPERNFVLDVDAFVWTSTKRQCDFWILANPHNPSGSALDKQALLALAERARERNVTVLLDEAFVDYCPEISISRSAVSSPNIVVLRSMTKFYGMAGLRVGFAVTNPVYADLLRSQVPSWPVSALAMAGAIQALADAQHSQDTLSACRTERAWLISQLETLSLRVFPSVANFLLLGLPPGTPSARWLRELLIARSRIVIRDCSSYQGLAEGRYFRIAVRGRRDNEKLIRALKEVLTS